IDYKIRMINPSIKNMAETVTLQIPEALYQRLSISSGTTQRSPNKTQKVSSSMTKLKSFIL
ncbi:MAG: hypothetical protein ACK47G_05230, partial [Pseudanabaena sp.]